MRKVFYLAVILFLAVFSSYSQSYKNLWTSSEYISGNNHQMMLVYSYDDFEDKKFYNFTDVVQNPAADINIMFFHFHWLEQSGLYGITVTVDSKEWYFLTGKIALKLGSEIIRLEGKESSKNNYPSLQTKVFIWGLPTGFSDKIKSLADDSKIMLRIYTKEKGYLDIDMPLQFFKEAANMTIETMKTLKEENGLK